MTAILDLPWAPSCGQTALRVIDRTAAFVLCEDKGNPFFRYLYTADGKCMAIGGETPSLKGRVMKPAPEDVQHPTISGALTKKVRTGPETSSNVAVLKGLKMQPIADEYLKEELILRPGNRLHRLVAMLFDTYYDDLSDERIAELEEQVESFRWMNAAGERLDQPR